MIKPFYLDLTEDEIEDIKIKTGQILREGNLILGPYTKEFENKFSEYIGTKYAVSLNSCTSALEVLFELNGARGKKVAVQTNTNFATVAAILRVGATPVFMDMDPDYFVPSLSNLKYVLKEHPNISGVAWVHIGGIIHPEFMDIVDYCKIKEIFLVEDCAHAHGSQLNGIKAGNFADGGAFSFFPTKVMTTMEGGMITTNNYDHQNLARSFRNQGKRGGDYGGLHLDLGNSWRINEISAFIGLVQLAKLDKMIKIRQYAVNAISPILKEKDIQFCNTEHMDQCSQYKFIIKYRNDDSIELIKEKFKNDEIILGGGVYEVPCHLQPVFKNIDYNRNDLNISEEYCPKHICPPITSGTTADDIDRIIKSIVTHIQ